MTDPKKSNEDFLNEFVEDVKARREGGMSPFMTWWKANSKQYPTHQFARAEFDRRKREGELR